MPDRPYDRVATITWESVWYGEKTALDDIRKQACEVGADAVIVDRDYLEFHGNPS